MADQVQNEANWNQENFVFYLLKKMADTDAASQIDAYFSYFSKAYKMTMNYHDATTRIDLENDLQTFNNKLEELGNNTKTASETNLKRIRILKRDFANKHEYFIYAALANMGIQKVEMEAEIDQGELSLEDTATITRNTAGMKSSMKDGGEVK